MEAPVARLVEPPLFPADAHAFYYAWYGNPQTDGRYIHWNHVRIPHWDSKVAARYSQHAHVPPDDIGASYYPALGPYSSADPAIMADHMAQLVKAGVGVIAVSYYAPTRGDPNVCWHLEPYPGRSAKTVRNEVEYIVSRYGDHPAFLRVPRKPDQPPGKCGAGCEECSELPLFYLYDSYQTSVPEWQRLLTPNGDYSVRGTSLDGIFLGLLVEPQHLNELAQASFDGVYTYFASHGFTTGSELSRWPGFAAAAADKELLFVPSVGPGYIDTAVRPWNAQNTKQRDGGSYYKRSITSFNEWHEGTQIERAVAKTAKDIVYEDYGVSGPDTYLNLTRHYLDSWRRR